MNRRRLLLDAAALASLPALPLCVRAQGNPEGTVRILTGSAAGTPGDVLGRALSDPLGRLLGRTVVVENRPGAIGTVALSAVARAQPDGTTLGVLSLQTIVAPHLLAKPAADPLRDVKPLRQLAEWGNVLVVSAQGPHHDLAALVGAARSSALPYASGGNGTPAHLAAELFRQALGLQLQHVPFQGAAAGVNAVLGGHVAFMFTTVSAAMGPIAAGRLRPLAVSTHQRIGTLPQVPTLLELGHPTVAFQDWLGLAVPLQTPSVVQHRLNEALSRALASPEAQERMASLGFGPASATDSAAFAALLDAESARWGEVIRKAAIRVE